MITYANLKSTIKAMYGGWVGAGDFIEDSSGSPTDLALLLDLVNSEVASYPNEWEFMKEVYTITFDGSTSYNLRTLIPDFITIYQLYGINDNQEHPFYPNYEANIFPTDGWSMRGDTLIFSGNEPTSGTAYIQYKSQYLVKNAAGTRKQFFEADTDYSILNPADIGILHFGVGEYIDWSINEKSNQKRNKISNKYEKAFQRMLLRNTNSRQIGSML